MRKVSKSKSRLTRQPYPYGGGKIVKKASGRRRSPVARYREPIVEMMKEKIKNG